MVAYLDELFPIYFDPNIWKIEIHYPGQGLYNYLAVRIVPISDSEWKALYVHYHSDTDSDF